MLSKRITYIVRMFSSPEFTRDFICFFFYYYPSIAIIVEWWRILVRQFYLFRRDADLCLLKQNNTERTSSYIGPSYHVSILQTLFPFDERIFDGHWSEEEVYLWQSGIRIDQPDSRFVGTGNGMGVVGVGVYRVVLWNSITKGYCNSKVIFNVVNSFLGSDVNSTFLATTVLRKCSFFIDF